MTMWAEFNCDVYVPFLWYNSLTDNNLVRYVILAISVAQIDFIILWLPYGSSNPKILRFNFSRPSTSFYQTIKMAAIENI